MSRPSGFRVRGFRGFGGFLEGLEGLEGLELEGLEGLEGLEALKGLEFRGSFAFAEQKRNGCVGACLSSMGVLSS